MTVFYTPDGEAEAKCREAATAFHRALLGELRWYETHASVLDCLKCSKPKAQHCSDGRCSVSTLSREFVPETRDREESIGQSLRALETLAEINGWTL